MTEVIEHSDNGKPEVEVVKVGESGSAVSVKVYQDVYHQVTGKTEQIRKRYSENLLIEYPEVEQLHYKIKQLCDVHNIVACNESVSIFHEKERKEQFTSFARFKAYNANAASPSLNIVLKYNFSIIPAGLQKPQEYVVTAMLSSRVAMYKKIEEDAPAFMRGQLVGFVAINTAEINVDYADYVIARGFVEAFDEWVKGCKKTPEIKWLSNIQKWSHVIPSTVRLIVAALISYFAFENVHSIFSDNQTTVQLAKFIVIYIGGGYISIAAAGAAGGLIEHSIDSYPILSYLKLNRGDNNLIDEFNGRRRLVLTKFLVGAIFTVVLGILSAKLERFL
ncbi:hypothetical protein EZJ19_03655 [Parasulfuritortus cantonensis]|uniref:Uncharacterized protein n=1 Tax=Parasulfuritortus cantonensis TaxID=2528202 RepID=A0A4R1BKX2_9PROT|nr:hypothetical protein [Parasulfuritortus cantonensis]TCJ18013.1 hypothetical protein EZJ19_03655 [Parasulfuritortus cantonensis]